jgi:ubiquinone/menaquinone biosynthesis C-methylase UbiE
MEKDKKLGLEDAYGVKSPDDNVRLYHDWAETYDSEFAVSRGYVYPAKLARLFAERAGKTDIPVLDVGAGTGLVAEALAKISTVPVDAIDISVDMLDVSREKGLYQDYLEADLTGPLDIVDAHYGAILSAGTFTHGHVGPVALDELLRIARPGALFCLGINATAFDKYGFGSAFAALNGKGEISPVEFVLQNYYDNATDEHAADMAYTAVFRKTARD